MNPIKNPFSPGAGSPPPELSGRQDILDKAKIALERLRRGKPEKSFFLVGLRGVGKTVLLNEIRKIADENNYYSVFIEAHENKNLVSLLTPYLRQILFDLSRGGLSKKVNKGFRIFKSFLNAIKVKYQGVELELDIDPERGFADSGDIEADIPVLLESIGEAISDKQKAVAIIIDELQYLSEIELSALIMAIHKTSQKALPVVLIGAGLPQLIGLAGRSKSYAERLFDFPKIGPLEKDDAFHALQEPVKALGAQFDPAALEEIVSKTKGYSYFLQEWGYQSWNLSQSSQITIEVVKKATEQSLARLDEGFFRVRFDRLTPSEKKYLRALAEFGAGSHRSGDIAELLKVKPQSVAPIRNKLIKKGMIYSQSHGDTEFTVPLFDGFMKRVMPHIYNT